MDLTGKKQFEDLDWLTQTVEPFEWEGITILAAFPDELELTMDQIVNNYVTGYGDVETMLKTLAPNYGITDEQFSRNTYNITKCFEIEATENVRIDLEENHMTGTVTLVKKKKEFTDKEILNILADSMRGHLNIRNACLDRMNEVVEVLGLDSKVKRSVSVRNKAWAIKDHIHNKVMNGDWKIKDVSLAKKLAFHIAGYMEAGDNEHLDFFLRFKMMTHSGLPIYKVEVK